MSTKQQGEDSGDYDRLHNQISSRDSNGYASDRISFSSLAMHLNVKVKNTFLDIGNDETDLRSLERRAASAPPSRARMEEQNSEPRDRFQVLAGPVRPCTMGFFMTMNDEGPDAVADLLGRDLLPEASLQVDLCCGDRCAAVAKCRGARECSNFVMQLMAAFPDLAFSLGDSVALKAEGLRVPCIGTQKYPFLPEIPSGRQVKFDLRHEVLEGLSSDKVLRYRWSICLLKAPFHIVEPMAAPVYRSDEPFALTDERSAKSTVTQPTGIMLRNLPTDLTRKMLLSILDSSGLHYNFVYLPLDFERSGNLGYASVNMVTHHDALQIQTQLEGFCSWVITNEKKCEVVWSNDQCLAQHIEHYRNCRIMHENMPDEFKPMLFKDGERVAFPPPTRKLKCLRLFSSKKKS